MSTAPTFHELEQAASEVIAILKTFPEFVNTKIVVIGGLAIWKHLDDFRTTKDVDFLITVEGAPKSVRKKLLNMKNSSFKDYVSSFQYKSPSKLPSIQIDMVNAAYQISSLSATSSLPYISVVDLFVFKIFSCGLRSDKEKRERDAADAEAIADAIDHIKLTKEQKAVVDGGFPDVLENSSRDKTWWKARIE